MAQLGTTFDATTVPEDERSFDPLPAGDYMVQVIDSEIIEKDNGDTRLKLSLEILDGQHQGRKLFDNLNVRHSNPTAQSIAQRSFADLILATGQTAVADTELLHFKPVLAKVVIQPAKGEYSASNQVRKYRSLQGQPPASKPAVAQVAAARAAPAPAPAAAARPWAAR